uniref:Uncharacterized protein n=1 Tax=Anguilla anguilla TaxID=7936 RepID=A0A0E9RY06_ANGAN
MDVHKLTHAFELTYLSVQP